MKLKHVDFGTHLEAAFSSSWGTWEAFGGHVGRLEADLRQHKVMLSRLGAKIRPT